MKKQKTKSKTNESYAKLIAPKKLKLSMLRVALFAVYWSSFSWFEGNFAFLLAIRADSFMHFSRAKVPSRSAASTAASTAKSSAAAIIAAKSIHYLFTSLILIKYDIIPEIYAVSVLISTLLPRKLLFPKILLHLLCLFKHLYKQKNVTRYSRNKQVSPLGSARA